MRSLLLGCSALVMALSATACWATDVPQGTRMAPGPFAHKSLPSQAYAAPALDNMIQCRPLPTATQWQGPYPAIILIHGGGWASDVNTNGSGRWCSGWASWGFVAFTINYRLLSSPTQTRWPAQIIDAQAAVRYVRAHAAELNVNPAMIGAFGDSAGGQMAMMLGYHNDTVAGDIAGDNAAQSSGVQFVVSEFGPANWGPGAPYQPGYPTPVAATQAKTMITQNLNGQSNADVPPTMFVQGSTDTVVSPSESRSMYCLLKSYHREAHYVGFPYGHEFLGVSAADFETVVGLIQIKTVAFAYKLAQSGVNPVIPLSIAAPAAVYDDPTPPPCS